MSCCANSMATVAAAASVLSLWAAMGEHTFVRPQAAKRAQRKLLADYRGNSKISSRHVIARSAVSTESSADTATAEEDATNPRSAAAVAAAGLIGSIRRARRVPRRSAKPARGRGRRGQSVEKERPEVKKPIVDVEAELAETLSDLREEAAAAIKEFRKSLLTFRIGGEACVDHIKDIVIDRRGAYVTLKELGAISVVDAETLEVKCDDETMVQPIANSLTSSNLSFDVLVNGVTVPGKVKKSDVNAMRKFDMYEAVANHLNEAKEAIGKAGERALKRVENVEEAGGPTSEEVELIINEAREEVISMEKEKTRQIAEYAIKPEENTKPEDSPEPFLDV